MNENNSLPVQLSSTLAVGGDGSTIQIHENGNSNLIFFQIMNQTDGEIMAQAVANIRLTTSQLEKLAEQITKALEESKKIASKPKK